MVARWAHNPKVVGSNPAPATNKALIQKHQGFLFFIPLIFLTMHFVYVLYSLKDHRLYKGSSSNIQKRLLRHNSGGSKSTANRKPFVVVHIEQFENKSDALKRENFLKTVEGGSKLIKFLKSQKILNEDNKLNLR